MEQLRQTMASSRELPPPAPEAHAHSVALETLIAAHIEAAGGAIDFARFMELALYAPGLGYYSAGARKFGPDGDFVTAPEISPLFSRCLARQCQQVLAHLGGGDILEFGAGSGVMAADILLELERLGGLPESYLIMEISADLRARQRDTLAEKAPHLLARVDWLDALPRTPLHGVALANEVLDAMPVHRFRIDGDGLREAYVARQDGHFAWRHAAPGPALAASPVAQWCAGLAPGYESEYNAALAPWFASLGDVLARGAAFVIDYGFPRHEFYHPQRGGGTLMCHYRHRSHPDPLILAGLQDITAHVDFTAAAEAAQAAGFQVAGFTNQAYFLVALGLTGMLAEVNPVDTRRQIRLAQEIKKLTLPNEMGELFKVMALTRGIDIDLQGFALNDQRARL